MGVSRLLLFALTKVKLKVALDSDKQDRNRSGHRFWSMVAHQAYHSFGPGDSTVVIADKVKTRVEQPNRIPHIMCITLRVA